MKFTESELEEMRLADEEIEKNFCMTLEEWASSRQRDIDAKRERGESYAESEAERSRAYYLKNRERVLLRQKAYNAAHKDECRERCKTYYETHREYKRDYMRAYRESKRPERKK